MAKVVITLKVMPIDPKVDFKKLEIQLKDKVSEYGGEVGRIELEPIAFGLKAIKIIFLIPEDKGGTDDLEMDIKGMHDVNSVEVIDVRRAIG